MASRKLSGEPLSLEEEARDCLDIHLTWMPEEQFEQAHALYETVVPGKGADKQAVFRRFLTEQFVPSQLVDVNAQPGSHS